MENSRPPLPSGREAPRARCRWRVAQLQQSIDSGLGLPAATESERAYNEGRSTQVPVNPVVRVKGRFRRQLRYGKAELVLER
jgi:hypothetical protein